MTKTLYYKIVNICLDVIGFKNNISVIGDPNILHEYDFLNVFINLP